jgi:hypothetical protein
MNFNTKDKPSRHKVTSDGDDSAANEFVGSFTYDPFSFQTLDNITVTDKGSASPEVGVVQINRVDSNKILAHTPLGRAEPARADVTRRCSSPRPTSDRPLADRPERRVPPGNVGLDFGTSEATVRALAAKAAARLRSADRPFRSR